MDGFLVRQRFDTAGIRWAQQAIDAGAAEEYALSATSLEDAYIELTGHGPVNGEMS